MTLPCPHCGTDYEPALRPGNECTLCAETREVLGRPVHEPDKCKLCEADALTGAQQ